MKVLIVCSGNAENFSFEKNQAFIYDQVESVKKEFTDIKFGYLFINGKGIKGYLKCFKELKKVLIQDNYDCIHAHFALSGLLANFQRQVPVITTFHGSDINISTIRIISLFTAILSKRNIYVSKNLLNKSLLKLVYKSLVIPCGVNFELFSPLSKSINREQFGLSNNKKYILFSSSFDNTVKNHPLAHKAIEYINDVNIELLPLKNYSRKQVSELLNVVDLALMTSFTEGSPQFVKEAIACNCPVVCTDVGDVKDTFANIEGFFLTSFEYKDVAANIIKGLSFGKLKNGQEQISFLDNNLIAQKIYNIYKSI